MIALAVSGAIQSGSLLGRSDNNAWGSWAILVIIGIRINITSILTLERFVFLVDDDDWVESVIKVDLSIIANWVGCDLTISIGGVALINIFVTILIIDLCASLTSLGFNQPAASHGSHTVIKVEGHRLFFELVEAEVLIIAVVVLIVVDSAAEVRNERVILFRLSVCASAITDVPTATPILLTIVPLSVGRREESCNSEKFVVHF